MPSPWCSSRRSCSQPSSAPGIRQHPTPVSTICARSRGQRNSRLSRTTRPPTTSSRGTTSNRIFRTSRCLNVRTAAITFWGASESRPSAPWHLPSSAGNPTKYRNDAEPSGGGPEPAVPCRVRPAGTAPAPASSRVTWGGPGSGLLAATLARGACQVERRKTGISEAVLSLALPHSEAQR